MSVILRDAGISGMQIDALLEQLTTFQERMAEHYASVFLKLYADGSGMIACDRPGLLGETTEIDFQNLEELSLLLCPKPKRAKPNSGTSHRKRPSISE